MISLDSTLAATMLTDIVNLADAGSDASYICIYDGTVPTDANTALTDQTQLAQLTCSDPTATVTGKTLTFGDISNDTSADATGTATFFRLFNSNAAVVFQGSVTDSGGNGDLKLGVVDLIAGSTVQITSASITLP
jgi:hypothetical protein